MRLINKNQADFRTALFEISEVTMRMVRVSEGRAPFRCKTQECSYDKWNKEFFHFGFYPNSLYF